MSTDKRLRCGRIWVSPFRFKSHAEQIMLIKAQNYRMAAMNLGAIQVQRVFRGFLVRSGTWNYIQANKQRRHSLKRDKPVNEKLYLRYKRYMQQNEGRPTFGFIQWVAVKIQSVFRMFIARKWLQFETRSIAHTAASVLQHAWRAYYQRRYITVTLLNEAAAICQQAWRSYTNHRIYCYYRDLILFREQGDPYLMLKSINPREAGLVDAASGIHLRFRLGGDAFPPTIFYKIFCHQPVTDICAFAPRDYHNGSGLKPRDIHTKLGKDPNAEPDKSNWYMRRENNHWRPVSEKLFAPADSAELEEKPQTFHHVKVVRREEQARVQKQRKVEWLKKMYMMGREEERARQAKEEDEETETEREATDKGKLGSIDDLALDEIDFEKEEDLELLSWTKELNYDNYQNTWKSLATSGRSDDLFFSAVNTGLPPTGDLTRISEMSLLTK